MQHRAQGVERVGEGGDGLVGGQRAAFEIERGVVQTLLDLMESVRSCPRASRHGRAAAHAIRQKGEAAGFIRQEKRRGGLTGVRRASVSAAGAGSTRRPFA